MCIQPRTGSEVPALTVRVARASNPRGTTAMAIRDHLDGLWRDEDFAEWYLRDGKPGLSPAQLATVSVLQFLMELSDRQAAEAVRCRIDFKYALGMELDDPGFHHSVLTDFRERLTEDGRADKLLDLVLERIKAAGLVMERGRQRTDSTHILSAVRDLARLELVTEAMRAALEELARQAPQELVGLVTEEWGTRYGRAVRLGKNPTRPKTRIKHTGDDVYLLLRYVRTYLRTLWQGPQVQSLRQIFLQNFWIDERARVRWREPGDGEAGLPPSSIAIVSPYDLTTRYARRNDTRWKGFLAHVTETCDDDAVNIITDVTTTPATLYDIKALPAIHNRLAERNLLPGEHLVDGGYTSVVEQDHVERKHGITLVGPVRPKRTRQSRKGNVLDRDAFSIDWERQHAVCPQGKLSWQWATPPTISPYVQVRFSKEDCAQCPIKSSCTRSDRRTLTFLPQQLYERQAVARAAQQTSRWKANYAMRAGIESTVNEFVNGHGMRQARYRSQSKTHVQHVLTAIAVNIERVNAEHATPTTERQPRTATALQSFLDWQRIPRPTAWRTTGKS